LRYSAFRTVVLLAIECHARKLLRRSDLPPYLSYLPLSLMTSQHSIKDYPFATDWSGLLAL